MSGIARFQFGMRPVIACVAILAVTLGVLANRAHEQRVTVNWVRANGGIVQYDFDKALSHPPGPKWTHSFLGVDFFAVPVGVGLNYTAVEDIAPLSRLRNLNTVILTGTDVGDLAPLAQLDQLETLQLGDTEISDVTALIGLKKLRYVNLERTRVKEVDVLRLQAALPRCKIQK